jgi:hypothetical protein
VIYKGRNAIERIFCRRKDYPRGATRYDKLSANFLSVYLAAAVTIWGKIAMRLLMKLPQKLTRVGLEPDH